jgi:SAM-dependent methyltransferase
MTAVFGDVYATVYDHLYEGKDYAAECRLIEAFFAEHGERISGKAVDFGCGTGGHAIPLAQAGWEVTGIDRSAQMLAVAANKAAQAKLRLSLIEGDLKTIQAGQDFDLAVMMFAVLGYQKSNEDVLAALRTVRTHLRQGGIFVFDVWHGPAVIAERPGERVKTVKLADGECLRAARSSLDVRHHLCTVEYDLWMVRADKLVAKTQESHEMRFFFPQELELMLAVSGLRLVHLGCFEAPQREPGINDWNVIAVAQAV